MKRRRAMDPMAVPREAARTAHKTVKLHRSVCLGCWRWPGCAGGGTRHTRNAHKAKPRRTVGAFSCQRSLTVIQELLDIRLMEESLTHRRTEIPPDRGDQMLMTKPPMCHGIQP